MSSKKSRRSTGERIADIISAIDEIYLFIADQEFEQFISDSKTLKAVVFNLHIIGEATIHLPDAITSHYPEISWRDIRGMRNLIVHEYFRLEAELIWNTIKHDLAKLKDVLEAARSDDT